MANRTEYCYNDETNVTLFKKIRLEPGADGRTKSFHCERIVNGQIVKNLEGCRKVLYRLPELLAGISRGTTIFLVEGEKDVENMLKFGLIATTAAVTTEWPDEFTQMLKGADAVILYDNDKTGFKRRDILANKLYGTVKRLRIVDLPGIEYRESHGEDISDWLAKGNTIEQLLDIVTNTPDYRPQSQFHIVSISELFAIKLPPREMLLDPFLPSQGLVSIVAKRGVGKTHIALGIAYAVATGGTFLRWAAPKPRKVLYIDGEMPAVLMQERLKMIDDMSDKHDLNGFFKLMTPDLQDTVMPNLSLQEGRDAIEIFINDFDLLVVDNLSCLFRTGNENDAESWQDPQEWFLDLRRRGKSVLFVHHAGKNGNQRGTSKKEDTLDAVIYLHHPDNYKPEQGALFDVKFDKARHFSGADASPFQAQLLEENGIWQWQISNDPEEELLEQIAEMKGSGCTILEIMNKKKLTKSQVETLTAKAKAQGLLI